MKDLTHEDSFHSLAEVWLKEAADEEKGALLEALYRRPLHDNRESVMAREGRASFIPYKRKEGNEQRGVQHLRKCS